MSIQNLAPAELSSFNDSLSRGSVESQNLKMLHQEDIFNRSLGIALQESSPGFGLVAQILRVAKQSYKQLDGTQVSQYVFMPDCTWPAGKEKTNE